MDAFKYSGLLLLLLSSALWSMVVGSLCDGIQFKNILPCLSKVLHGVNGTYNILAGTDTSVVQAFCSNGTSNETLECLEDLYRKCGRHHEGLLDIAKPATWRTAFANLCDNLAVHAKYNDCIVGQRDTVQECLHYNDVLLDKSLSKEPITEESFTLKVCCYYEGMRVCTAGVVKEYCDKTVGKLFDDFLRALSPQEMCRPGYKHVTSRQVASESSQHMASHWRTLFAALVSAFFIGRHQCMFGLPILLCVLTVLNVSVNLMSTL